MESLKKHTLHPFLFTIYPILALWAANINLVIFDEVWRALLIALAAAGIEFCLLRLARLGEFRAGLLVSLTSLLFFSYGHVLFTLARIQNAGKAAFRPELVTLLWPVAWILGSWLIIRRLKSPLPLTPILNTTAVALVAMAGVQVLWVELSAALRPDEKYQQLENLTNPETGLVPSLSPDIYYIILDGYSRQDILKEIIGLDNSPFIHALETRGFYVARHSTSNYSNTTPSIASSLNFDYVNHLTEMMGRTSMDYRPLRKAIRSSQIRTFLERQGYQIVTFESGFNFTDIQGASRYISPQAGPNYFESLLLTNSFALLWTNEPFAERYRDRITSTLERLSNLSDIPSPKFVFAHVMAAHPPYVFGSNGEKVSQASSVALDTGDAATRQAEIEGYRNQVTYLNQVIMHMVDSILAHSANPPIIILQGDHGSGIYMDWQSAEHTCFTERKAILNAYYFPDQRYGLLTNTITPVNSFRVILNTYFGQNLPLLEDRNYFSLWESPYDISNITGQTGNCPSSLGGYTP